jgi:hypothetical protein
VTLGRETDEAIQEVQFITLSYVQAQHDYLAGNYPVVREDAAQVTVMQGPPLSSITYSCMLVTPWVGLCPVKDQHDRAGQGMYLGGVLKVQILRRPGAAKQQT